MKFIESSRTLGIKDLEDVEMEFGIVLPREFKDHYLECNGGYPEKNIYTWFDGGRTAINTFSSIKEAGFNSLEHTYRTLIIAESYLPLGIVPFATDDGGNMFCISSRELDFGSVYSQNNDHYNTENKEEALTLLDKSFKHFVDNFSD